MLRRSKLECTPHLQGIRFRVVTSKVIIRRQKKHGRICSIQMATKQDKYRLWFESVVVVVDHIQV